MQKQKFLNGNGDALLTQMDNDETLGVENTPQIGSDDEGNYTNLRNEIGDGGDKSLTKKYYRYAPGDGNTIEITRDGVIDGKGAVIDMAGSNIGAFEVSPYTNVTIKNLTIKNANCVGRSGGAICFLGWGSVVNCNLPGIISL